MRNLSFVLFVLALLVGYQAVTSDPAVAQGKKKAGETGVIEVKEGKDGKYRFNVRDEKGKLLAQSSLAGYATVKDAEAAIDRLKSVLSTAKVMVMDKKAKAE